VLLAGCRSNNCELVERQLFERESELAEANVEKQRRERQVEGLEAEVTRLQRRLHDGGKEAIGTTLIVRRITLGRLTGGYDANPDLYGDDALQVLLEPRDIDDASVKAAGSVHIDLYEVSTKGTKDFLSSWDLAAKDIRAKWETPLLGGSAYRLVLPWKIPPSSENLRVVVQFTTLDGVKFEADKDITIRPPARAKPKLPQPHVEELHLPRTEPTPETKPVQADEPPLPPPVDDPFILPTSFRGKPQPAHLQPVPRGKGGSLLPPTKAKR
jgi:hypothetical protein